MSPDADPLRGAFVSWVPSCGRSQAFIDAFGLEPVFVSYLKSERPLLAPLKYGPQLVTTLRRLQRTHPDVVFVMDPPPFAAAAAFLYCLVARARLVMDCHSGVFEGTRWRWALPLQRFFGRYAAAVIVTNPVHQRMVSSWPARALIVSDPPPRIEPEQPSPDRAERHEPPVIFVIVRFGDDEAIPQTLAAAGRLPNVRFEISGDVRRANPRWLENRPANVRFTGWLSTAEFWDRVRRANAVLTLTTRENTILRGGWEAMFTGQPLITSGTRALRAYFTGGTVFADNSADGIAAAVRSALAREDELRAGMRVLQVDKRVSWNQERRQLERLVGSAHA